MDTVVYTSNKDHTTRFVQDWSKYLYQENENVTHALMQNLCKCTECNILWGDPSVQLLWTIVEALLINHLHLRTLV